MYLTKCLVLLSLPLFLEASCVFGPKYHYLNSEEVYCAYETDTDFIVLHPEEYFEDDYECMNCTCGSESGLQCCGYGIMAGYMGVSDECQVVMLDNCNYRLAKWDNENEDCYN